MAVTCVGCNSGLVITAVSLPPTNRPPLALGRSAELLDHRHQRLRSWIRRLDHGETVTGAAAELPVGPHSPASHQADINTTGTHGRRRREQPRRNNLVEDQPEHARPRWSTPNGKRVATGAGALVMPSASVPSRSWTSDSAGAGRLGSATTSAWILANIRARGRPALSCRMKPSPATSSRRRSSNACMHPSIPAAHSLALGHGRRPERCPVWLPEQRLQLPNRHRRLSGRPVFPLHGRIGLHKRQLCDGWRLRAQLIWRHDAAGAGDGLQCFRRSDHQRLSDADRLEHLRNVLVPSLVHKGHARAVTETHGISDVARCYAP